jgi:hypothetical protein
MIADLDLDRLCFNAFWMELGEGLGWPISVTKARRRCAGQLALGLVGYAGEEQSRIPDVHGDLAG